MILPAVTVFLDSGLSKLVENKKQTSYITFLLAAKKGQKQSEKNAHWDGKRWPRRLNSGGRLKGFYLQYYTGNSFGTLVTGRLIGGGRLDGWPPNRGSTVVRGNLLF